VCWYMPLELVSQRALKNCRDGQPREVVKPTYFADLSGRPKGPTETSKRAGSMQAHTSTRDLEGQKLTYTARAIYRDELDEQMPSMAKLHESISVKATTPD
jgi:hypothetical protein